MECLQGHEMTQEEVLTHRTTSPTEDDQYKLMWWCDICEEAEIIEPEGEYE